jgi:beta-lactamase class A
MELPDLDPEDGEHWSVCVVDADAGAELASLDPDLVLSTASVAKVFALVELASRMEAGELRAETVLDRRTVPPVHDSGLWHLMAVDELSVEDVAVLVGAVSDNLATNVLLDLLGIEAVQDRARQLAPGGSMLHDHVRDDRQSHHPAVLSSGCARDWAGLFAQLHRGEIVSPEVSLRVLGWCAGNADLSMVASALDLDPLSHGQADLGLRLWNKTGTDRGVRADVGLVRGPHGSVAYAAICTWDDSGAALPRRQVLTGMRAVGERIRAHLKSPDPDRD